jgi:hypothetical protein
MRAGMGIVAHVTWTVYALFLLAPLKKIGSRHTDIRMGVVPLENTAFTLASL